jgi:hypothetical protein
MPPKPSYTINFVGTLLSSSPWYSSKALGKGTRWSVAPCWMSVGVFACLM